MFVKNQANNSPKTETSTAKLATLKAITINDERCLCFILILFLIKN